MGPPATEQPETVVEAIADERAKAVVEAEAIGRIIQRFSRVHLIITIQSV
jgi:hypothetical protein